MEYETRDGVNRCHYNLNAEKAGLPVFVLQSWESDDKGRHRWITAGNTDAMVLTDVRPWSSPAGIQRVLNGEKRKVVMGLVGKVIGFKETTEYIIGRLGLDETEWRQVRCNPKERDCFFYADNGEEFKQAAEVILYRKAGETRGRMYATPEGLSGLFPA